MFAIVAQTKKMFCSNVSALFVVKVFIQMRGAQQPNNFHKYSVCKKRNSWTYSVAWFRKREKQPNQHSGNEAVGEK